MNRLYFLYILLSVYFSLSAQDKPDTLSILNLKEIVVGSERHYAVDHGIVSIPTIKDKRHSSNVVDMLGTMMIPGLDVNVFTKSVKTIAGADVNIFIDGIEASDWQIKTLRPKDVARVEMLYSPTESKYKGYQTVLDFVSIQYSYGGYVFAEANQSFINNVGDYFLSANYKKDKVTLQLAGDASYSKVDEATSLQNETFNFGNGSILTKESNIIQSSSSCQKNAALSLRYDGKGYNIAFSGGFQNTSQPRKIAKGDIRYNRDTETWLDQSISEYDSKNQVSYLSSSFQIKNMPHNATFYGGAKISYNHNNANGVYSLVSSSLSLPNSFNEHAYLPSIYLVYNTPVSKRDQLLFQAMANIEIYKTQYKGTDSSHQELINNYYMFLTKYTHQFCPSWSSSFAFSIPVQTVKVNDNKWDISPLLYSNLSMNGRICQKHSLYLTLSLSQSRITPSYFNTVERQDNEVEGSMGNANLKSPRIGEFIGTYTYLLNKKVTLTSLASCEPIYHDVVPFFSSQWFDDAGNG